MTLPNPPAADGARNQRADVITEMAFTDGKLMIADLSNEEFVLARTSSGLNLAAVPLP